MEEAVGKSLQMLAIGLPAVFGIILIFVAGAKLLVTLFRAKDGEE